MIDQAELERILKIMEENPVGPFDENYDEDDDPGVFYHEEKLNKIRDEIQNSRSKFRLIGDTGFYKLYAQKDSLKELREKYETLLVVSSHADNLQGKSAWNDTDFPGKINGIFDNASTNAVCVYIMKHETELPENVLFAFTADEENDSRGAKELTKFLNMNGFGEGKVNCVVLDVTCGWHDHADFTIENDFFYKKFNGTHLAKLLTSVANRSEYLWDFVMAPLGAKCENSDEYVPGDMIESLMIMDERSHRGLQKKATQYRDNDMWVDETVTYDEADYNTFSLCLPCSAKNDDEMHDDKGFLISRDGINHYTDFLAKFLRTF